MRRVDQDMAGQAAEILHGVDVTADLRTRYRTLRVMAHTSGLAATYAYVASKSTGRDRDRAEAYRHVRDGIGTRMAGLGLVPRPDSTDPRAVLTALGDMDTVDYLKASSQVTDLLGWLARLADAIVADRGPADGGPATSGTGTGDG